MNSKYLILLLIFLFLKVRTQTEYRLPYEGAQHYCVLLEGDTKLLRTSNPIGIQYDYSNMQVCTFSNEQEYLGDLKKNNSPTKAEKLIQEWTEMRPKAIEPDFKNAFNEFIDPLPFSANNYIRNSGITLIVHTMRCEPDYHKTWVPFGNYYKVRLPFVTAICTFVDQENKTLAKFVVSSYGSREKNTTDRLSECYRLLAKTLAKNIKSELE